MNSFSITIFTQVRAHLFAHSKMLSSITNTYSSMLFTIMNI